MDQHLNSSGLLTLVQHFRRLDWDKAIDGLTQPEYLVLAAVELGQQHNPDQPGIYVSALAEYMMISVSMASKLLKTMEEKEWILRTIDRNSRRNTFVSLTPLGKETLARANQAMERVHRAVRKKMGKESLEQLISNVSLLFSCYEEVLGQM